VSHSNHRFIQECCTAVAHSTHRFIQKCCTAVAHSTHRLSKSIARLWRIHIVLSKSVARRWHTRHIVYSRVSHGCGLLNRFRSLIVTPLCFPLIQLCNDNRESVGYCQRLVKGINRPSFRAFTRFPRLPTALVISTRNSVLHQ
jgi:hypothetical protein